MLKGHSDRTNDFRPDPEISSGSVHIMDYKSSGYDRGHLVPAADMKVNAIAMSESFYMSNIALQSPSFNRGIWKNLEALIRSWASKEEMHIVTGGLLTSGFSKVDSNGARYSNYFYKVVYAPKKNSMIAFLLPNRGGEENPLDDYVVSVDEIEQLASIDFFPQFPDDIEENLESKSDTVNWDFTLDNVYRSREKAKPALQCLGIAKTTRVQCENRTKNENGYCYIHQYQSPDYVKPPQSEYAGRCNAVTRKGTQCKRSASYGTRYCWQHQK